MKDNLFKVLSGDPFGGYVTIGENLTEEQADKLVNEESQKVDYFTSVFKKEQ